MTTGQLVQAVTLFSRARRSPLRVVGLLPRGAAALPSSPSTGSTPRSPRGPGCPSRRMPAPCRRHAAPLRVERRGVAGASPRRRAGAARTSPSSSPPARSVALVGATGSGKSDAVRAGGPPGRPRPGANLVGGVRARRGRPADLHRRVALVLQEAFLFADPVAANVRPAVCCRAMSSQRTRHAPRTPRTGPGGRLRGPPAHRSAHQPGERGVTCPAGNASDSPWPGPWPAARPAGPRRRHLGGGPGGGIGDPRRGCAARAPADNAAHRGAPALHHPPWPDRVLFLEGGRLVASGAHDDLLALPSYAALARAYERAEQPPRTCRCAVTS